MKKLKIITAILFTLSVLIGVSTIALAERPIKILMGGEYLQTPVAPVIIDGRTMVPLRTVFEGIGAVVEWDNDTQTVTAKKGKNIVKLQINSKEMSVNDEVKEIDVPAQLINDRTMVPIRACSEAFGLDVEWNDHARLIRIKQGISVVSEKHDRDGSWEKYQYDQNGDEIFYENSNGNWKRTKTICTDNSVESYSEQDNGETSFAKLYFNNFGELIKFSKSDGTETEYKYDDNGNCIYARDADGIWWKTSYFESGREVFTERSDGYWKKEQYDINGHEISSEDSTGELKKYKYDTNGNMVLYEVFDCVSGNPTAVYQKEYQYDSNNNLIYEEWEWTHGDYFSSSWTKYYYENNKLAKIDFSDGTSKELFEDTDGYTVKNSDGTWSKYIQDTNGNIIYEENSDGSWIKYIVVKK